MASSHGGDDGRPAPANDYSSLPVAHVTVDQIVAMNTRHWRRAAGMTQEELGEQLGWSAANVSAAERSADEGRDRRRFDADTLTALCLALGVPLIALFLPPEDDGTVRQYRYATPPGYGGSGELHMKELMELVVMPDSHDDSDIMAAYRHRLTTAATAYLDPDWSKEVARWLREVESAEERAIRAEHLRNRRAELLRTAGELGDLADAIDPDGGADGG
jgi:transcriptional regulator with XRE-family HTH domain